MHRLSGGTRLYYWSTTEKERNPKQDKVKVYRVAIEYHPGEKDLLQTDTTASKVIHRTGRMR